jgi:hypothetical protein
VPLWNPYENLGMPLAGNPAASVFYPGKLIFALPISYPWAYKIYIMGHLLLAAYTAYRLARHWQASVEAAGLCALSYAFSGNVLFTYCNVVFLVGAAWLPCAMLAADRMLTQGSGVRSQGSGVRGQGSGRVGWAVVFGAVLAMMVLGGDPQMAYNAGLLAAFYAVLLWRSDRASTIAPGGSRGLELEPGSGGPAEPPASAGGYDRADGGGNRWSCLCRHRLLLLTAAALVGLALSAVQVLPSMELTAHSDRIPAEIGGRLLGRAEPGTHSEHTYHFSVGPWRLAEYLWPNVGGRQFPVHRRWLEAIPAEGRIWTPSLYMGLLPLLLALAAMRLRRSHPRDRWLSWSVVLAVAASFGWYGLGWLIHEVRFAAGGDPAGPGLAGEPFGGLYWLMTLVLPGYACFRYPAKLLVVAALGLSVLAARGFDHVLADPSTRFRRRLLWLGGLSLGGAVVALAIRPFWSAWLGGVQPDPLLGPLDTTAAANDLLRAFLQTAVLCGAFWWLLRLAASRVRWVPVAVLLLTAVDLAVANRWLVVSALVRQGKGQSEVAEVLREEQSRRNEQGPYRVFRQMRRRDPDQVWLPPSWTLKSSRRRLSEAVQWDRNSLWPKYNLGDRISLVEVPGTMMLHDYQQYLSVAKPGSDHLLLAKYVILPGDEVLRAGTPIDVGVEAVSLWHHPRHLPRAWIVHRIEVLPPLGWGNRTATRRRTEEVLHPPERPRDLRKSAVVEVGGGIRPALPSSADVLDAQTAGDFLPDRGESCRVLHHDPLCVEIEAELSRPGLVILSDQFYPGWKLEVDSAGRPSRSIPILRANRVMRGAWLPEGRHRLTYRYRPWSFICGAIISGLAWIAVAFGLVLSWSRGAYTVRRASSRDHARPATASRS